MANGVMVQVSETQANKALTVNENFKAVQAASLFGAKVSECIGLTWSYYGGVMKVAGVATLIADGGFTLSDDTVNYISANSSGVVSKYIGSPTGFQAGTIPLYKVTVVDGVMTEIVDYRMIAYSSL